VKSFVASAWSHGVGVLIDFHALPGGANTAEHSGTNSGVAALWNNEANLALATQCLEFLAREITSMNGVAGLQLCNEAIGGAPGMYQWYDAVIAAISVIDPTIPLFISDGWNTAQGIDYVKSKNKLIQGASPMTNPICVDSHQYFCFTEDNKSPQEVISSIPGQLSQLDGKNGAVIDTGAAQVIVGEWSCALSGATWSKVGTGDRKQLTTQFGKAQCDRWLQQAGGSFFWTLKMDWMDGGDWGFVEQTNTHAIHPPNNLTISSSDVQAAIDKAQRRMQEQGKASYLAHEAYWKQQAPDGSFEHERYQQGWNQGWNDALAFFSMRANGGLPGNGGDKIGMLELWVRKRVGEYGNLDSFAWEYETGLRKGVLDFYLCAGV
jgi:aryl-phospho-beta-D-glucosidase BglC (GH1 family)